MYSEQNFCRNKIHLQNYQRRYKALKRVGRRKMSLEDRAACENKRRREMEGSRLWVAVINGSSISLTRMSFNRTYTNAIVRRDTTSDPEQTDHMRTVEREAWTNASFLLIDLWRLHGEENWDEYTPPYLDNIRILLKDELTAANIFLNSASDYETLHLHWRIIAFYHQEIELRGQGEAAWQSAVEDEALVMYGRRYVVNCIPKAYLTAKIV